MSKSKHGLYSYGRSCRTRTYFDPRVKFEEGAPYWEALCGSDAYNAMQLKSRYPDATQLINQLATEELTVCCLGTGLGKQEQIVLSGLNCGLVYLHELGYYHAEKVTDELTAKLNLRMLPMSGEFETFPIPESDVTMILGNHLGNLKPRAATKLVRWIRRTQRRGAFLLIEWTAPFTGDWRYNAQAWPNTGEVRTATTIEREWYEFIGTRGLGGPVSISLHPILHSKDPEDGYELYFIAHRHGLQPMIVGQFLRYTVPAMTEICRRGRYRPVRGGLWQNGPSTIMLLRAV